MQSSFCPQRSQTPPSYQSTRIDEPSNDGQGGFFAEHEPLLPPSALPGGLLSSKGAPGRKAALLITALTLLIGPLIGSMVGSTITNAISTNFLDPGVRDQIRVKWELEVTQHAELRQGMAQERARWDAEREAWEEVRLRERHEALEERRRAREKMEEEEERRKAGIHWLEVERSPQCKRYGTREYRAKLGPVGAGYDPLKACRETGVEIHGRVVKPNYCEDMGAYNGMWGVWMVDFDEAACRTYWGDFNDQGCTAPASGLHRIEANLKNHNPADEWTAMCASTPYDFNGLHFDGAMSCANWGKRGIFGFWDIEDKRCE